MIRDTAGHAIGRPIPACLIAIAMAIAFAIALSPCFAHADEAPQPASVASSAELAAALEGGAAEIVVAADFEIDRTFYVMGRSSVVPDGDRVLTRAPGFAGDMFVVGESADGADAVSAGSRPALSLGGGSGELAISGNAGAMEREVEGSAFFVCNGGEVALSGGAVIRDCEKVSNARALGAGYHLPNPSDVGGAAAVVANGTLVLDGGRIEGCRVNDEPDGSESGGRPSSEGGAVFNCSTFRMAAGSIEGCSAARGGAVYNYRRCYLAGGEVSGNSASRYGGAVYQAATQFSALVLGEPGGGVSLERNSSQGSGGALFSQTKNSVLVYGGTAFRDNRAASNGGAAYLSGMLTARGSAAFEGNAASSKGGALYVANADDSLTTRLVDVEGATFKGNSAGRGGAVGMMAAEEGYSEGGIAAFRGCSFEGNGASGEESSAGGALYAIRKSRLALHDCSFAGNSAAGEGGAVYASGESSVEMSECSFERNRAEEGASGGAVSLHSCDMSDSGSVFAGNAAAKNAGALNVSYVSDSPRDSAVSLDGTRFEGNSASQHGGAAYLTCHAAAEGELALSGRGVELAGNSAGGNGGGLYVTAGAAYLKGGSFARNVAGEADEDANGGAAAYCTKGSLELDGTALEGNSTPRNGGAIGIYSGASLVANGLDAEGNSADGYGGAIYSSKSEAKLFSCLLSGNSAGKGGGALACLTGSSLACYGGTLAGNSSAGNGGAAYVYTGGTGALFHGCSFEDNRAPGKLGGAIYCSSKSLLSLYSCKALRNSAGQGGFLYMTTGGTQVAVGGLEASGNMATDSGPIVVGNAKAAVLRVDKGAWADADAGELDDAYWKAALAGKLTVEEAEVEAPDAEAYAAREDPAETPAEREAAPVDDVFSLDGSEGGAALGGAYASLPALDATSNFSSRATVAFPGVAGSDPAVDVLAVHANEAANNCSFGEAMLVYQAMLYKRAHPERDVTVSVSSFHFSVEAAACVNRSSRYFGYMRNLAGAEYDANGFVRVGYLLVSAAKMGVRVTAIGQIEAYPRTAGEPGFEAYFASHADDHCDERYASGTVGDFLDAVFVGWTSYGDDAASDMMHTKACAVSAYLDREGREHSGSVWLSSTNLDGIQASGANGNNALQTACIVSDHDALFRATRNYLDLIASHGGQEDVYEFRELASSMAASQLDALAAGGEVASDELIVYPGAADDPVFELYFSPFGGGSGTWDEARNPFCKYLRKLSRSDGPISLAWCNVKYRTNYALADSMERMVVRAFHDNAGPANRLFLQLPGFGYSAFDDLAAGSGIGLKSLGRYPKGGIHNKDMLLSYSEGGRRELVTMLTSLNLHQGAMSYQSNLALVVKEDACSGDGVFAALAAQVAPGVADAGGHSLERVAAVEPTCEDAGSVEHWECSWCGARFLDAAATMPAADEDDLTVAPLGHAPGEAGRDGEVAATCEEPGGYDEVVACSRCGEELSREHVETGPLGHDWDEGVVARAATADEEGELLLTCRRDPSHTRTAPIPRLPGEHDGGGPEGPDDGADDGGGDGADHPGGEDGGRNRAPVGDAVGGGGAGDGGRTGHEAGSTEAGVPEPDETATTEPGDPESVEAATSRPDAPSELGDASRGLAGDAQAGRSVGDGAADQGPASAPESAAGRAVSASFSPLKLHSTAVGKRRVSLAWEPVSGAASYAVYGARCGRGGSMSRLFSAGAGMARAKVKRVAAGGLQEGAYYRFRVVALDAAGAAVAKSATVHVATAGGKWSNPSAVRAGRPSLRLSVGSSARVSASAVLPRKAAMRVHRGMRFESSDPSVATVGPAGKLVARSAGSCLVYAYAQNGASKRVKVTVVAGSRSVRSAGFESPSPSA